MDNMPPEFKEYFELRGGAETPFPEIAGKYSGRLIICGDGRCLWDDLEKIGAKSTMYRGCVKLDDADFMVVNQAGIKFPGNIEHWYSNDVKNMPHWIASRRPEYRHTFEFSNKTHSNHNGAKYIWPFRGPGTSGLNACLVGCALGYQEIILCGMPLDDSGHSGEPHWRSTNFSIEVSAKRNGQINRFWQAARDIVFKDKVKSVSGRSREWLGGY